MPQATATRPSKVDIYLPSGTTDGFWVVNKPGWSGRALLVPRDVNMREREKELSLPGVYLLSAPPETLSHTSRLYIGESGKIIDRLKTHRSSLDFWHRAVVFTGKDRHDLHGTQAKYLESKLIERAVETRRAHLETSKSPNEPSLSEGDRAGANAFLEQVYLLCPIFGVKAFQSLRDTTTNKTLLHLSGKRAEAQGAETSEGFVVFEGARVNKGETKALGSAERERRRQLLEDERVLTAVEGDEEHYRLTEDTLFTSASQAAKVVLGAPAAGTLRWKTKGGTTLGDLRERDAAAD